MDGRLYGLDQVRILGILNLTEDSFFPESRIGSRDALLRKAGEMLSYGADILDLGACSTRPGALPVTEESELNKLIPAISHLKQAFPECLISVDTFRANVASQCVDAGAAMVNDISGGTLDPLMFATVARLQVPYILTHMRGTPETMQTHCHYEELMSDLILWFSEKISVLHGMGVHDIIIDPGFGFAKNTEQNFEILNRLEELNILGKPVLVGLSRKSMIKNTLGCSAEEALNGTSAMHAIAVQNGANFLRVHDVKEAKEVLLLMEKIRNSDQRKMIIGKS